MSKQRKEQHDDIDWSLTTWEGSRREQLRRWCKLTLRERLGALEEMGDIARHFADMRTQGRFQDRTVQEPPIEYGPAVKHISPNKEK